MEVNANKINVGITVNVDVTLENIKYVKKIIFGALVYVVAKMVKYWASIIANRVITCDEIIDAKETKIFQICKTKCFYILIAFLSITVALLIVVSIYCSLVEYNAQKEKINTYYHSTSQKTNWKTFYINNILKQWRVKIN